MYIKVLKEAGYDEAARGFSLSWNSTEERAKELFPKFAKRGGGEDKFLESIMIWLEIEAPRFWWSEADTYRISTKQSQSTMHTLGKKPLTQQDFERPIPTAYLDHLNDMILSFHGEGNIREDIKNGLPEGYLQSRVWVMSYKTLKNIVRQRHNHKLSQWRFFCESVLLQIEHPELISVD